MAWDDVLDPVMKERPEPRGVGGFFSAIGRAMRESGMSEDERRRATLLPLETRRLDLQNRTLQSALDELVRDRAEKAAAPGSMRNIYEAAAARAPIVEWGDEEGAGVTRAQAGRPAARTVPDLMARGVSAEDLERGSTYLPKSYEALKLLSPEDAEKKAVEDRTRKRLEDVLTRAGALDRTSRTYVDDAYRLAAEGALAKGDMKAYLDAVARTDDPVAVIGRLRDALKGEGGPNDTPVDDRIDFEIKDGKVVLKSKQPKESTAATEYPKAVKELEALEEKYGPLDAEGKGHPEVVKAARRVDRYKSYQTPEGATITGAGTRAPIAKGPDKPLAEGVVQDLRGVARLQSAAKGIDSALTWSGIDQYIGPYDQYRSQVQRLGPMGVFGDIPPDVIDLEQNLASVKNYTIKLITGAQMSIEEGRRIMAELPTQGNQPQEFRQRWAKTKANIQQMARMTASLALRGDARARAVADDLGIDVKPLGGSGAPAGAPAPAAKPTGDTLSRKSDAYRRAKARGMSDGEIEAAAGAKLTD